MIIVEPKIASVADALVTGNEAMVNSPTELTIEAIAIVAHNTVRAFSELVDDDQLLPWDESPEWVKQSAIRGVAWHLTHLNATPEESHEEWMRQKQEEGWSCGPEKSETDKQHPCMVPYAELDWRHRTKDFLFSGLVNSIYESLPDEDRGRLIGSVTEQSPVYDNAVAGTEGITDWFKGLIERFKNWNTRRIQSREKPNSEWRLFIRDIYKYCAELERTYGNDTWLAARTYADLPIDMSDCVKYITTVDRKQILTRDLQRLINQTGQRIRAEIHQQFKRTCDTQFRYIDMIQRSNTTAVRSIADSYVVREKPLSDYVKPEYFVDIKPLVDPDSLRLKHTEQPLNQHTVKEMFEFLMALLHEAERTMEVFLEIMSIEKPVYVIPEEKAWLPGRYNVINVGNANKRKRRLIDELKYTDLNTLDPHHDNIVDVERDNQIYTIVHSSRRAKELFTVLSPRLNPEFWVRAALDCRDEEIAAFLAAFDVYPNTAVVGDAINGMFDLVIGQCLYIERLISRSIIK